MKIKHYYTRSDSHSKKITQIKNILDEYNLPYTYNENLSYEVPSFRYNIQFQLSEDLAYFAELRKKLSRLKLYSSTGTEYEDCDYEKADWFIVGVENTVYPKPDNNFEYLSATFNLDNYCKLCGMGKVQNAPYRIERIAKYDENQFWGLYWEHDTIFVGKKIKDVLEKEQILGIRFSSPINHKTNQPYADVYQLHLDMELGNGFDSYNTKVITCKINNEENCNRDSKAKCCGRIKYHHPMIGGYLFDKDIFNSDFDIVKSAEYFGSGAAANRLVVVSKRLKNIIESNKFKGIYFIPVMHEKFQYESQLKEKSGLLQFIDRIFSFK